jgi:hypothetical protein
MSSPYQPPRRDQPPSPLPAWPPIGQPRAPEPQIASVPRRYGPGTLMVITAAYALLFGGFKAVGADDAWWIGTAAFFTGIGIAQMIGGPKNARPASMIAGGILLPVILVTVALVYGATADFAMGLVCTVLLGVPLGYAGGVLVAGIFLLMGYADAAFSRGRRSAAEEPVEADMLGESDTARARPDERHA